MPAVPSCILDPLREEFLALLPPRVDRHPLGCHRRRIDDRIVFDKIVQSLVLGAAYEKTGRNKEAVLAYEDYLRLAPNGSLAPAVRSIIEQLREQP